MPTSCGRHARVSRLSATTGLILAAPQRQYGPRFDVRFAGASDEAGRFGLVIRRTVSIHVIVHHVVSRDRTVQSLVRLRAHHPKRELVTS
jgi:hypothetical protein